MARKKQRETYGNGSIRQKKRNGELLRDTWDVCITLGSEEYTDKDGNLRKRQRKVQKVVHGSLADARAVCKQLVEDYKNVDADGARMAFADVVEAWAAAMENANTCAPQRLHDYKKRLSYVSQKLGKTPIIEVKKQDIESALFAIKAERDISQRTLREVFMLTKRVFKYAVLSDWAIRNPCDAITAPKAQKNVNRRSLTMEECARLRARLDRDEIAAFDAFLQKEANALAWGKMWGRTQVMGIANISGLIAVRTMLATGMRRGEAMGLTWEHIDFANNQIKIRQALDARKKIKGPKTAAGIRTLFVDADTMQHLATWKEFQKKALHRISIDNVGQQQTIYTPVCCDCTGSWYDLANFSRWWRSYSEGIGFKGLKVHELRHTQATMLLGAGMDIKTVQTRLGHADASMTLNQYAHSIPANDKAAADVMAAIYGQKVEATAPIIRIEKSA